MTEVFFHFNVPDRTQYTCRLLRKATRAGASVVLTGPVAALTHFDRALWTFDPIEFVPHVLVKGGQAMPERLKPTPLWLAEDPREAGHHEVLVNLGIDPPVGFERFTRVIEIVTADEADRIAARERWKHYKMRGYVVDKHEVAA